MSLTTREAPDSLTGERTIDHIATAIHNAASARPMPRRLDNRFVAMVGALIRGKIISRIIYQIWDVPSHSRTWTDQ